MLTRPGLEKIGETCFAAPIRFLLLNGAYSAPDAQSAQIYASEVSAQRPLATTITTSWNSVTASLDVVVSALFTPTDTLTVNKLALVQGPANEFGFLPTASFGGGQFELEAGTTHDIVVGQQVYFSNGTGATIDSIAGLVFDFTMNAGDTEPGSSANVFPANGSLLGVYNPASTGVLLAGNQISITVTGSQSAV